MAKGKVRSNTRSSMGGRARSANPSAKSRAPQHPGLVLAEILADTPPAVAAKWFGLSQEELAAVLTGNAPLTAAMAAQAGTIFGTGAAPWLEMQAAWDEATGKVENAPMAQAVGAVKADQ